MTDTRSAYPRGKAVTQVGLGRRVGLILMAATLLFMSQGLLHPAPARADCCDYYDIQDGSSSGSVSLSGFSFNDCEETENNEPYCQSMSFNGNASLGVSWSVIEDYDANAYWVQINEDDMSLDITNGNAYWYPVKVSATPDDNHYEWWNKGSNAYDANNVGIQNYCPQGCNYSSNDANSSGSANAYDAYWDAGVYQTDTVMPDDNSWSPPSEAVQWGVINLDIGNQPAS